MGLDYYAYIKRNDDKPWEFSEEDKLAYGRKCWELVNMFGTPTIGDCCGPLDKCAYFKFVKSVEDFGPERLQRYYDLYREIDDMYLEYQDAFDSESCMNSETRADLMINHAEFVMLDTAYEHWWQELFNDDDQPTLGLDFAVGYILDFYNARDRIMEAWTNDEEVWCFAWY